MKLSESRLRQIVNEELQQMIDEGWFDRLRARTAGGMRSLGGKAKGAMQRGVGKLATAVGGDDVGAALQKKGDETATAARGKATGVKLKTIFATHVKEMSKDLDKLGLSDDEDVKNAMGQLRRSLDNAIRRSDGMST